MKLIFFIITLVIMPLQWLQAKETDDVYGRFIDTVRPFDFKTVQDTSLPIRYLSDKAKSFGIFAVMLTTQYFFKKRFPKKQFFDRLNEEFSSGFIQRSVNYYFDAEKKHKKIFPAKDEEADHIELIEEVDLLHTLPTLTSVASLSEIQGNQSFDFDLCASQVYQLISDQSFDLKEAEEYQKKTKFSDIKANGAVFNLDFFDQHSSVENFFFTVQDARDALLFNWRITTQQLESFLKYNLTGQDKAIESFVSGIFNHYANLIKKEFVESMNFMKYGSIADLLKETKMPSSILILGPSGCGKTEMVQLAGRFLGFPIGRASGANLSPAGYKGDDPSDSVNQLIAHAEQIAGEKHGHQLAEKKGIIFIDEIDKLTIVGDTFREGSQTTLLTFIEGSQKIKIDEELGIYFDSSDVLFIFSGAFSYMEKTRSSKRIMPADLIRYGLLPELVNRMRSIVQAKPLMKEDFLEIMVHPKNSPLLQVLREIREQKRIHVTFIPDALEVFAADVEKDGIGARNLYGLLQMLVHIVIEKNSGLHSNSQSIYDLNANILEELALLKHNPHHSCSKLIRLIKNKGDRLKEIEKYVDFFDAETKALYSGINDKLSAFKGFHLEKTNETFIEKKVEQYLQSLALEQIALKKKLDFLKHELKRPAITAQIAKSFSILRKDSESDEKMALLYGII